MNKKILVHFKTVDPLLYSYITNPDELSVDRSPNHLFDLCEAVIWQQLSDKAASKIVDRFLALFGKKRITAGNLLQLSDTTIRNVGISWSKVHFIKEIAKAVDTNRLVFDTLKKKDNEAITEELTKIKGIGPWTAQMFLMFSLGREDVFSPGDLGLRKAIQKIYKLKREPTFQQAGKIAEKWSPYRTYACLVLWKILDG